MRDEEIAVAIVQNYGNIASCGIRSELVKEHHGPGKSSLNTRAGKDWSNVKRTQDLNHVSMGCLDGLDRQGGHLLGSSIGSPPNR